jgi:hypothetical protein
MPLYGPIGAVKWGVRGPGTVFATLCLQGRLGRSRFCDPTCRVAPASCPAGALSDPDEEIATIRLFRGDGWRGRTLPSGVPGTGPSTSKRGACFPPEVHHHTGRLCSAGSGGLPRYPTSSLICGPPTPLRLRPGSGFPRVGLPLGMDAFLHRPDVRPRTSGASEGVEPGPPWPRLHPRTVRGLPGYRTARWHTCRGRTPRLGRRRLAQKR